MKLLRPEEITPELMSSLRFQELTPEELREVYALALKAFTAEDLQRYTEIEEGVPAEDVLRELEEAQKEFDAQRP